MIGSWSDSYGRKPFLLAGFFTALLPVSVVSLHLTFPGLISLYLYYPATVSLHLYHPVLVSLWHGPGTRGQHVAKRQAAAANDRSTCSVSLRPCWAVHSV